jgi:sugar phosphate isomerase/epimerase
MELGISSYTYTWAAGVQGSMPKKPLTHTDLIDKAALQGVKLVQIADNIPLETLKPGQIEDLKKYAAEKNVSIEMGGRGLTPGHTLKCLETAQKLNSSILRMVIDSLRFEPDTNTIISILKDLLPELKSRKIRLALENHDRLKARDFAKIIEATGSNMVGICLDSVNSMGAGEGFESVFDTLIPYTINLHIKDFKIFRGSHKMGFIIEGRPAGQGMLDIPQLIERVEDTGLCHSAILELWTPPAETINKTIIKEDEWAVTSINYLKSVVDITK